MDVMRDCERHWKEGISNRVDSVQLGNPTERYDRHVGTPEQTLDIVRLVHSGLGPAFLCLQPRRRGRGFQYTLGWKKVV